MIKSLIYLLLFSLLCYACAKTTDNKNNRISYEIKNFRVESASGCTSDTMQCAYYEVNYPVFSGLDSSVNQSLVRRIDAAVSMGNPEAEGESMRQIGEGFVQDYVNFSKEITDATGGWYYRADVKTEVVTDTLLSLSVVEEYFTGGAHGGHGTYFINIDPRTGADFTLSNLLSPGYEEALTQLGERSFRHVRELPDTASLMENYFEFPDDKFALNQNYGFRSDGIVFYYNNYEIAAYAAGPTEVFIPYSELKALLR
jgi:Protein of unknown function (DUF3298)/Deacetylase PdaC